MADLYISYNEKGNYVGHVYGSHPKIGSNLPYRKLTREETTSVGINYYKFKYDEIDLRQLLEVHFSVVPSSVYQLSVHNKISISLKRAFDTTDIEYSNLVGNNYKIKINEETVNIPFEDTLFLDPQESGVYVIELDDDRLYSSVSSYVVTVIDPPIENTIS
jgi:hypothetical protein